MRIMLDNVQFKNKPSIYDVKGINNRLAVNYVDISIEELAKEIIKGRSFIPAYLGKKDKNGESKRSKDCWSSQELLCLDFDDGMTIEEAINEFKNKACFIYTTFSHTEQHHKFRVVFKLNKKINNRELMEYILEDMVNKYKDRGVDIKCIDCSRIFYGGRKIIELNYNNLFYIDNYIIKFSQSLDITMVESGGRNSNLSSNILLRNHLDETVDTNDVIQGNNIKLIKNRDVNILRSMLNITEETVFYTKEEVRQFLKSRDLNKFLGVYGKSFNCIFHEDNNPSSGIIFDDEKDLYIYNCFSDNCEFGAGTIFKNVEYLLDCDKVEALNFLMGVYNIELKSTPDQERQRSILSENMAMIRSGDLEFEYPMLHKRIKNYLGELHTIHEIAKETLPPEHYDENQKRNLFFLSVRYLANLLGMKNSKRMSDRLALFAYLGILFKLKDEEIPKQLLDRAEEELKKNKLKYDNDKIKRVSFFSIPSYTPHILNHGQKKAIEFEEKGFTMKGWSYEMLLRALGEEEAERVYPVMKGVKTSKKSNNYSNIIEQVTMNYIESRGWATEKLVVNTIMKKYAKTKTYTEVQIKKIMAEMVDKYDLKRERLSKSLKEKMNIDVKGYPFIIYKG